MLHGSLAHCLHTQIWSSPLRLLAFAWNNVRQRWSSSQMCSQKIKLSVVCSKVRTLPSQHQLSLIITTFVWDTEFLPNLSSKETHFSWFPSAFYISAVRFLPSRVPHAEDGAGSEVSGPLPRDDACGQTYRSVSHARTHVPVRIFSLVTCIIITVILSFCFWTNYRYNYLQLFAAVLWASLVLMCVFLCFWKNISNDSWYKVLRYPVKVNEAGHIASSRAIWAKWQMEHLAFSLLRAP